MFRRPFYAALSREIAASNATCLFYTPEPWEGDELFSFYQFAKAAYGNVFDDITVEVHPDNPRFDDQDRPPPPVGAFKLHDSCKPTILPTCSEFESSHLATGSLHTYLEGTTLRGGLDLVHIILVDLKPAGMNIRGTICGEVRRRTIY